MIGSNYTMIVAPNYAIGVKRDIEGERSVIIKSAKLANYIYQSVLKYGRDISYSVLDEIITANIGRDITDPVNDYVYSNFGHRAEDISVKKIPAMNLEAATATEKDYIILTKDKYVATDK